MAGRREERNTPPCLRWAIRALGGNAQARGSSRTQSPFGGPHHGGVEVRRSGERDGLIRSVCGNVQCVARSWYLSAARRVTAYSAT